MKNVLLTGGAGFIGSHVADVLLEQGCNLTVYDNLSFGNRAHVSERAEFIEGDLTDRNAVFAMFKSHSFDTVVHLAAIHFIPYCNQHPNLACRSNIEGSQNVFDAAADFGIERLFTASTAAVYPDMPGAIPEVTARRPIDVYGITKATNEEQAALLSRRSGAKVCVGRLFNAVGARETNPHLVPDILARIASSGADVIEIGNVSPKRDYIDVRDMARAISAFVTGITEPIDTCNIGTGAVFDVEQVVAVISEIHGRQIRLKPVERLIRKVERQNLQADICKIRAKYHWEPRYSLADSLRYAYDWYANKPKS
jgi:UDP-glucose 4-epimerase